MSRPSSVLIFATRHTPTGGIESHLQEFCRRLSESGILIDLIILDSTMLPETSAFFRKVCRKVYLGSLGKSYGRLLWLFMIKARIINRSYDAIYTNGQGNAILLFSKLFTGVNRWVHHHHTSGDESDQKTWSSGYRRALIDADIVIACSAQNAANLGSVLHRMVQTIPCFSKAVNIVEQGQRTSEKIKFGYYGRLIPEKGIDILCRLSNDVVLRDIEFHIWGEGKAYPEQFFSLFPRIHFHGSFSGEYELRHVIGTLDAYLLLSSHPEGLPIALLEIMSSGLPWLATDMGGIPDIACDPQTTRIISSSSNYEEIKNAILNLADDIKKGEMNKQNQQHLYNKRFAYPVLVKKWSEILGLTQAVQINQFHNIQPVL